MLSIDKRVSRLHPDEVRRLHAGVSAAEDALLFAPAGDGAFDALRGRACELSADLLSTLGQLERRLRGDDQREGHETQASWIARQTAPSGVTHGTKPNGRADSATEQRVSRAA